MYPSTDLGQPTQGITMARKRKTRKTHRARKPNKRAELVRAAFARAKRSGRKVDTKTIFRMSNSELERFAR
jgi:hypothetical protein